MPSYRPVQLRITKVSRVQAPFVKGVATGFVWSGKAVRVQIVLQAHNVQRPETATESDTLEHVPTLGGVQQSTVPGSENEIA